MTLAFLLANLVHRKSVGNMVTNVANINLLDSFELVIQKDIISQLQLLPLLS
jgi:hypothetical protein